MKGSVGDFLIERLKSRGLDTFFGVPGDYTLNFYDQLSKNIKGIGTTNELNAGYAADAYARIRGIGCVCVTYCVGGFSAYNAIAGAYAEKSPVIIISGSPGSDEKDEGLLLHHMVKTFECQHEVFKNITCASTVLNNPDNAGYEIDRVLLALEEHKQPIYIEIPRDIVDKPISYDPFKVSTPVSKPSDPETLEESIREVVEYIKTAKKPVIWAGVELARFGLGRKVLKFAERNKIPIASTVLSKSVIDETHPLSLGVYCESAADDNLKKYMEDCDCLIMLGVMMTDMNTGFLPLKYTRRQTIIATTDGIKVKNHCYENVRFIDFAENLLKQSINREPPVDLPRKEILNYTSNPCEKIRLERFFHKLETIISSENPIVSDIGESLFGALGVVVKDNAFISNGFYTSMGFAVPGSLGVYFANTKNKPIVLVGDGAFQMTGQEFGNLVRNKIPAVVFVLNNQGYGTERLMLDGPFNDICDWSYSKLVQAYGGKGYLVTNEGELDYACSCAMSEKTVPSLIEIKIEKNDHGNRIKRMFVNLAKKVQ